MKKPTRHTHRWLASIVLLGFIFAASTAVAGTNITLKANDGGIVYGTLTRAQANNNKILLLFHQAGSSRHEYDPVVPVLTALGYDTLAIDQRSGGKLYGPNTTVAKRGGSSSYLAAMPDIEATLNWAVGHGYDLIVPVGSSYSASLVILLAARHPDQVDALASFSPGEYFKNKNLIKNAAAKITKPFYITAAPNEGKQITTVLSKARDKNVVRYLPEHGVHGASQLRKDRALHGWQENRQHFTAFLSWLESQH